MISSCISCKIHGKLVHFLHKLGGGGQPKQSLKKNLFKNFKFVN